MNQLNLLEAYVTGAFASLMKFGLLPMLLLIVLAAFLFAVGRHRDPQDEGGQQDGSQAPSHAFAPAQQPAAPSAPASSPQESAEPPAPRLLVVDDSAVVRVKLRKLFESRGYEVVVAEDGEKALAAMEAAPGFAVVITDLEMPNMDGFELIAAIQGSLETENVPIIAITGREDLQARVYDCQGLYGIFRKPWVDRELIKRVDSLAAMRRSAEAAETR